VYRARAKSSTPEMTADPAATILPLAWIATPQAAWESPAKSVVTFPSALKVGSREPPVV
jgi:hypothetical protein